MTTALPSYTTSRDVTLGAPEIVSVFGAKKPLLESRPLVLAVTLASGPGPAQEAIFPWQKISGCGAYGHNEPSRATWTGGLQLPSALNIHGKLADL